MIRYELAKLLFMADNGNAEDPEHEWEMTTRHNPRYADYVYAMADAIIAAGWTPPGHAEGAGELPAPTPACCTVTKPK